MEGQLDIVQILLESGPIVKGVLILLVIASVMSWAIVLKKKKLFSLAKKNNKELKEIFQTSKTLKDSVANSSHISFSPLKNILNEASREYEQKGDVLGVERAMKKGVNDSNIILDDSLSTLASISSASPFVGLFGTVWGIINSFTGLAGGGATLDAVAPGIAEALVATAVGLVAAIPAMWFFNKFNNEMSIMNIEMESFEQDILNSVERSSKS